MDENEEQSYVYLETIQEETSDDLRSDESDRSEAQCSPTGWLATDSESGSVIRMNTVGIGKQVTYDSTFYYPANLTRLSFFNLN